MSGGKALAGKIPALVEALRTELDNVVSACNNGSLTDGKISGLEHHREQLFEVGNGGMLALPGITDGSDPSVTAEHIAGKTRMLCRLNLKALVTFARANNKEKVNEMAGKAKGLMDEINNLCRELEQM